MAKPTRSSVSPSLVLMHGLVLLAFGGLLVSCSGSSGGGSSGGSAQIFLQDAPPVTVTDQAGTPVFEMRELWLTITGAELERDNGQDVPLTLASPTSAVVIDIMTLDDASILLALGNFPAGLYEEIELTVTSAEMVGTNLVTGQPATIQVAVPSPEFSAEFDQAPVLLDPAAATTIVIDWRPAVDAVTQGATTAYTLRDEVHSFVPGATAGGQGQNNRDTDISGTIVAIDCAAGLLTIAPDSMQGLTMDVQLFPTTQYVDGDDAALPGGCADLVVGQEVEVDGLVPAQLGALFEATKVELEDDDTEFEGVVENLVTNGNGFIEFDLRQGTAIVAHVVTDANTEFELDVQGQAQGQQQGQATAASVQNGSIVEAEGALALPATTPPTLLADEVEIH